ncbi:hypothetical protein GCM10010256_75490 [Streptomyces coeruleorubidus]|nr:hypothetical protein [Streptomyces coeruleorubidus]GGU04403.1 hypothetical protein GCM10010256_75490 [Streptomyces coeruleorubidus]
MSGQQADRYGGGAEPDEPPAVDPFREHAAGRQDRTGRVEGGDHGDDGEVSARAEPAP